MWGHVSPLSVSVFVTIVFERKQHVVFESLSHGAIVSDKVGFSNIPALLLIGPHVIGSSFHFRKVFGSPDTCIETFTIDLPRTS